MYCQSNKEAGAVFVETALSMIVFLIVLVGGLQIAIIGFRYASLQHTANSTLRWLSINYSSHINNPIPIEDKAVEIANTMGVPLRNQDVSLCTVIEYNNNGGQCPAVNTVGDQQAFVVVQLDHEFNAFFGFWTSNISATAIGRNEPL